MSSTFYKFFKNFLGRWESKSTLLMLKEPFFEHYTTRGRKTANFAVAGDDTMAGDNQRQRVLGQSASNSLAGGWTPEFLRQLRVTHRLAKLNFSAGG